MFENLPGRVSLDQFVPTATAPERGKAEQARKDAAEAKRIADNTTWWDGLGASATEGTVGFLARHAQETQFRPDPTFRLDKTYVDDLRRRGVSEDQLPLFDKAVSKDHAEFLYDVAIQNQNAKQDLAQFGIGGNLLLGAADPGMVALDALAAPLAYSAQAGRVANAVRAGTVASAVNTALGVGQMHFDPEVHTRDLALNAALGFAIGSPLGARMGEGRMIAKAREIAERIEKSDGLDTLSAARTQGATTDNLTVAPLRRDGELESGLEAEAIQQKDVRAAFGLIRRDIAARFDKAQSAFTRLIGRKLVREGVGYTDRNIAVEESASEFAKRHRLEAQRELRWGMNDAWSSFRKENGLKPWDLAARSDFNEQVGRAIRGDTSVSAQAQQAAQAIRPAIAKMLKIAQKAGVEGFDSVEELSTYFPRMFSAKGFHKVFGTVQSGGLGLTEDEVLEQLVKPSMRKAWEERAGTNGVDVHGANQKLQEVEQLYKETSAAASDARDRVLVAKDRAGIARKKAEKAAERAKKATPERQREYTLRADQAQAKAQRAADRVKKAEQKHAELLRREDEHRVALEEARKVTPEVVDEDVLHAVAKAWLRRAQQNFDREPADLLMHAPSLDDLDTIGSLLDEGGTSAEKKAEILSRLGARTKERSTINRARPRIDMDENFKATIVRQDDGTSVEVSMADLLENDVEKVLVPYFNEMSGWSAMASKLGVRNKSDLAKVKSKLARDARNSGDNPEEALRLFSLAEKYILGRSTEGNPGSGWSRAGRMLRDYNFPRVMNQVGFSMIAELGPMLSYGGFRNTLGSIPAARRIVAQLRSGKLTDAEARAIAQLVPPDFDLWGHTPFMRTDENVYTLGGSGPSTAAKWLNRADNVMQVAKAATGVLSGMAPITHVMQVVAARSMLLRFLDMANASELSAAEVRRLRQWGLTEDAQKALFKSVKGAQKIEDINLDAMDFTTRERLSAFMHRATRHMVVEGDLGDSWEFMHSALGKIVMQFRTFMMTSYTRHFLNAARNMDDWRTWAMLTTSTFFAGLAWSARTYINTAGDPQKRERLLTTESIAKAAFQQSSYSSVLPMLVDTLWGDVARNDYVFGNNARGTGLQTGLLGIPTVDLLMNAYGAISAPGEILRGDRTLSRDEYDNLAKVIWFNNLTGVRNINDAIAKQFPTYDPDDKKKR